MGYKITTGDKVDMFLFRCCLGSLLVLAIASCFFGNFLVAAILYSSFVISTSIGLVAAMLLILCEESY
jgi:hypothetical protein